MIEKDLIQAVRKKDRKAQRLLYDRFAPKMFGLCKRYVKSKEDAEDVLMEGFFKVLTKIDQYGDNGSFEGWIRRIMVNESLMFLRKRHNFSLTLEVQEYDAPTRLTIEDELAEKDILGMLNELPTGYRTIFNLYVVEGYKHREIAELLGISINTSKSQLILAKKRLKTLLIDLQYPGIKKRY